MKTFTNNQFTYKNNELYCEEVSVKSIIEEFGTPVYIYSKDYFVQRYREFTKAFKPIKHTIFFAVKSNYNLNVMKIFVNEGSGLDVNSEGELFRAELTGIDHKKIILTGVGKTENEIDSGIDKNLLLIKAESIQEIELINNIAKKKNVVTNIAIRINPDVDPKTHPYISTGLSSNKFGISTKEFYEFLPKLKYLKNINFTGLDMHIGSQILSISPFVESIEKLAIIFKDLKNKGFELQHFDIGGGIGVNYKDEKPFSINEFAEATIPLFEELDCEIMFEPGRYLTANGGALISKVLYTKENSNKNFIVVDSSMTELLRPSIYKAFHFIQPISLEASRESVIADIVGPVCESGDFLGKDIEIQKLIPNEYLAIMSAGAYGMVMSSNYNMRRKPAEVIVDKNKAYLVREKETYEHILYNEKIIHSLNN